ncbi:hypothetical protein B0H67DRAFT_642762 [Lasiosphaeris hirsuta]|uniref:Uncharacterized protein n=1 Tax=Lasiosphaeris hirsuta TaxID=260670 RepID=A0AA40DWX7_9PEZI|nr:hypothetical protein B0H67DRAFT_642762 [Lasiosphaeris hirsuta]
MSPAFRTMLLLSDDRQLHMCSFFAFSRNVWHLGTKLSTLAAYQTPMFIQELQEIFARHDEDDGETRENQLKSPYHSLGHPTEALPQPDYDKTVVDVYTEACVFCLENAAERHRSTQDGGRPMLLYAAPRPAYGSRLARLPSWAPDLSQFPTFDK